MTDQAENAALLVAGVAIEIGKLAVEMADVAGDVQRVSRLVDGQAELFGGLRESTDTVVASNQHIAEKAAETLANAATAQEEVKVSSGEIETALAAINALVDSVRAIGTQLAAFELAMKRISSAASARASSSWGPSEAGISHATPKLTVTPIGEPSKKDGILVMARRSRCGVGAA